MFHEKPTQQLTLPGEGEFGFYNAPELVKRGYETWRAQGRMPTRAEVEQIDMFWHRDLMTADRVVRFAGDIADFEGGQDTEQEFSW